MNKILFIIAGVAGGSRKTTITYGILSLLVLNNYNVQIFKFGSDYIYSVYHSAIIDRPCVNIDNLFCILIVKSITESE